MKCVKCDKGSVLVAFAIMLPALILFISIAVDGALLNFEKARLTDSLNGGVFAVKVANHDQQLSKSENTKIALNYIKYYFNDRNVVFADLKSKPILDSHGSLSGSELSVVGRIFSKPIISFNDGGGGGFDKKINVSSKSVAERIDSSAVLFEISLNSTRSDYPADGNSRVIVTAVVYKVVNGEKIPIGNEPVKYSVDNGAHFRSLTDSSVLGSEVTYKTIKGISMAPFTNMNSGVTTVTVEVRGKTKTISANFKKLAPFVIDYFESGFHNSFCKYDETAPMCASATVKTPGDADFPTTYSKSFTGGKFSIHFKKAPDDSSLGRYYIETSGVVRRHWFDSYPGDASFSISGKGQGTITVFRYVGEAGEAVPVFTHNIHIDKFFQTHAILNWGGSPNFRGLKQQCSDSSIHGRLASMDEIRLASKEWGGGVLAIGSIYGTSTLYVSSDSYNNLHIKGLLIDFLNNTTTEVKVRKINTNPNNDRSILCIIE